MNIPSQHLIILASSSFAPAIREQRFPQHISDPPSTCSPPPPHPIKHPQVSAAKKNPPKMSQYWRPQIPPYGSPSGDFHSEVDARDRFWRQSIINRYGDDARNPAVSCFEPALCIQLFSLCSLYAAGLDEYARSEACGDAELWVWGLVLISWMGGVGLGWFEHEV
ncbi:hypothetical protein BST61_g9812 [Cercospora zeina]